MSLSYKEIIEESLSRIQNEYGIDDDEFWEKVKEIAEVNLDDFYKISEEDDEF